MAATATTDTPTNTYKKREGTSGIRGQLYETKLLSLIFLKALHADDIEEFHLATNVDQVGCFDDICLRMKVKGFDKPIAVFIQAKHRETIKVPLKLTRSDLVDYFNSYLAIRQAFQTSDNDLFKGKFHYTDCLFIMYTTSRNDKDSKRYEGEFIDIVEHLNGLIRTGDSAHKPSCKHKRVELCQMLLEEQITTLARQMVKYIYKNLNDQQLVNDELVLRYHVILAQNIFEVYDHETKGRMARFREDFFDSCDDECIQFFKDQFCTEIIKRRKIDRRETPDLLLQVTYLQEVIDTTKNIEALYKSIGNRIIYKNRKFEYLDNTADERHLIFLEKINESKANIQKAVELAIRESFPSLEFAVPKWFGNKDLTIRGADETKVERKLKDLTKNIVELLNNATDGVATIKDSPLKGFLKLSGGIASAVGNILVYEGDSKLRFTTDYESLGKNAKKLFDKLKVEKPDFQNFTFDVKVDVFPKRSFARDEYNESLVTDFLSKLLFYTSQENEQGVQDMVVDEIQEDQGYQLKIISDAIFLKYHDEIQKWWIESDDPTFLTKDSNLYENAVSKTANQPLMSVINIMQIIKNQQYIFNSDAANSINLDEQPSKSIIVTENSTLTAAKFTEHLKYKHAVALDLEYILNLAQREHKALCKELKNANDVKIFIIIFDKVEITPSSNNKIEEIAKTIKDTKTVVITNQLALSAVKKYFSVTAKEINDERIHIKDMDKDLQDSLIKNTKVIFQDKELYLEQVIDNESIALIGGDVLYKLMHDDKNIIGRTVSSVYYDLESYLERSVRPVEIKPKVKLDGVLNYSKSPGLQFEASDGKPIIFTSLHSLTDHVAFIIADPGMGKSTLLTHASLKTKESFSNVWILRINLLEHSREFETWHDTKMVIDSLESLKFMCRVALSEQRSKTKVNILLEEQADDVVRLKSCSGDAWTAFELELFLHFYNTKKLIFLFDGFDEICPDYEQEVMTLINLVKDYPRKHRILITSRPGEKIEFILEKRLGAFYEIVPLTYEQQKFYLSMYWFKKDLLNNLNSYCRLKNIYDFITFMAQNNDVKKLMNRNLLIQSKKEMPFITVYLSLIKYLKHQLKVAPTSVKRTLNNLFEEWEDDGVLLNQFVATPLHLNLIANYLYNKIKEIETKSKKWELDTNILNIYESFLNTKLKILFEEKNEINTSKPKNKSVYKKEYEEFVTKHKILAVYAIFHRYYEILLDAPNLKVLSNTLETLKTGEEKTGIICNVVNDVPVFVHSTFAEYFAVEYICDLLKSDLSDEHQTDIWNFILNIMFFNCNTNLLVTLDSKMKIDTDLLLVSEDAYDIIFELLMAQGKNIDGVVMKSSLCEAIRHDLRDLSMLFMKAVGVNLDKDNIDDFIKIVKETNMLIIAVQMEFEDIIETILNKVRKVDKLKVKTLFTDMDKFLDDANIDEISNDKLIYKFLMYMWERLGYKYSAVSEL